MKKAWNFTATMWRPALVLVVLLFLLSLLFGYRLGSLTGSMSQNEASTYESARSLSTIWNNPINAPYKIAVYALHIVSVQPVYLRLASVVVGMLTIFFFFMVSYRLFKPLAAVGVTTMLATSTIFLTATRSLDAQCMLLGLVFLLWVAFIFRYYRAKQLAWVIGGLLVGLMLYTPGIIFFVLAALIWQQKRIRDSFERLEPVTIAISTSVLFAVLLPLIIGLFLTPDLYKAYLGIPQHLPALVDIAKSILYVPASVVGISPKDPAHWLGQQPILDVITSVFFIFGLVSLIQSRRLDRLWAFLGIFIIGSVWVGLSGQHSNIIVLVPFIYLCVGLGMQALIQQWYNVFPRNPIARWLGTGIVITAVVFSISFQLIRYFIAWGHSPATRAAYSLRVHK